MTNDNDQFAREEALAREYERKMAAREQRIQQKVKSLMPPPEPNEYRLNNLHSLYSEKFTEAFAGKRYEKPSEFFLAEMPWIFELLVYDRFREAFLHIVDHIRDFPYTFGWNRRSFRSEDYLLYAYRIHGILAELRDAHCVDADICDTLTRNLPEGVLYYIKTRKMLRATFSPAILAYELDRDNPRLERIITDIVNGDSDCVTVSRPLIRGMAMSHNPRMHRLLCRLLVAAKLQEGLRQAICEEADWGTMEAFHAILSTILEHDLLRYSSVKRAVGTWVGLMNEDTRDLDRISNKTVELIFQCLSDLDHREACAWSQDAMQIHIALWSTSFENVQKGYALLDRIIETGTHQQVLAAGYFVDHLENDYLLHSASRAVLRNHWERYDILAVYLHNFLPNSRYIVNMMGQGKKIPEFDCYFGNREDALQFCDRFMELHSAMKKKELVFSPCIFPWYAAVLKRSELLEKAMILAVALEDRTRIDKLCGCLCDIDASGRDLCFRMMTMGKKTPAVRKAIIDCMADKSIDTRTMAFERAKGMALTDGEYLRIEDMLRLRYDDLRRNAMELLLKRDDEALRGTVSRLLASAKAPMRTAGLDILTQLRKDPEKQALVDSCMEFVRAMSDPTTQEQILIDALEPKQKSEAEPLFTEADRYEPRVELDDYAKACIRAFMEIFPDSRLEAQATAGNPVRHGAEKREIIPCEAARKAKANLKSLSDFIVANETQTFTNYLDRSVPVGCHIRLFADYRKPTGQMVAPRMDLWQQWREENGVTLPELFGMFVLANGQPAGYPYLIRCGKYIADLYGPGFQERVTYRYAEHLQRIVHDLIFETIPESLTQQLAAAVAIWIARCLPEEMFIGSKGEMAEASDWKIQPDWVSDDQARINVIAQNQISTKPAGHFVAHPQISDLLFKLRLDRDRDLPHRIPLVLNIYDRTFESTKTYMKEGGHRIHNRVTLILDQIYHVSAMRHVTPRIPEPATYLYAHHCGLISERSLYYHLMAPGFLKKALELVTAVCAMRPEKGKTVSARTFSLFNAHSIRRVYEEFIGKETELDDEQLRLVELCRKTADVLVPVVVGAELNRGDTPAEYSAYVTGIHVLSGIQTFVKILSALGRDPLDRSVYYWGNSESKRGNLSYLLARCTPAPGDDVPKLAGLLEGTDITPKRLVEAALYSPAWIDIIGEYLKLDGFKSACYYFMAHMNERFDEQKKAVIARYSPLSEDEFNQGAFDVAWFRSAYEQLGEKTFDLIYDAAKYISDGSKHTRARKFADAALGRMEVSTTEAAITDKRNKDLLMAYAVIPLAGEDDLIRRYLYIQQFLKQSRQFGAQRSASEKKAVEAALRNLATNAGFTDPMRLTLRMETKLVEDNRELFEDHAVGEWVFRLHIDEQGSAAVLSFKDGKALKSIPTKAKKDPYVLRLQEMKKQLTDQYRRTRRMFEQAMEDGTAFTLEEMRQLARNPVVAPIISKLVLRSESRLGLFDGMDLLDLDGDVLTDAPDAVLTVAHPFHLYSSGQWPAFQKYLFDGRIAQPFKQVFRELYVKTKDESEGFHSLRYAGNQIQPRKAAACLKERRWVADIEAGLQKVYYRENIVATIYALADWFTPADIEAPTLEYVAFYHRKTGKPLKIHEIPDVIFSEVMRDVDMAVSVAHAGGVDPETSHSTVEMRAAILEFTLPLLRLDNVRIEGSHAFIDGKLAKYSIHLGSGVVHQLGGAMLSVLPVHSQHRGRFFLPFLDDDPKTAEIISKVILFSEDKKLKDPGILSQIRR